MCLEQKFLTSLVIDLSENLKDAVDLSLDKCAPAHPHTILPTVSENSRITSMHSELKMSNTLEAPT